MIYFFGAEKFTDRESYLKYLTKRLKFDIELVFLEIVPKGESDLLREFVETFIDEWLARIESGETLDWKGDKLYARNYEA